MEKDIPLKIEILSSGKDDQYCITASREIEFILQNIAKAESVIALYYSEENDFVLTRLLGVDNSGLWLEQRPTTKENKHVLDSHKLIFVASHFQIKVQFSVDHAVAAKYQGQPALFLRLPKSIHRLQRREYFRLATPVFNPLLCIIPVEQAVEENAREVTIMDISGGGVGLTCTEQDAVLVPGQTYENCKIDLLDSGEFIGTIEVKNLVVLSTPEGQTIRRAGCEFKNLDGASTILLQRYVTTMQRAKIKE
jgi:c-di-GMP-binding flagellar brake protein YcgR